MRVAGHRMRLTAQHMERAGIPRRFWDVRLAQVGEAMRDKVDGYLRHLSEMLDYGQGLHLHGANGTGKTSIAVLVAMEALRLGASVLFVTAEQLRRASIEEIWFDEGQLLLDRAREVELLVIDDLGKEHRGESGYAERLLEDILRQRSSRRLTTIFTTNVPVGDAKKGSGLFGLYSQSMLDVSRESLRPLKVSGDNVRRSAEPLSW